MIECVYYFLVQGTVLHVLMQKRKGEVYTVHVPPPNFSRPLYSSFKGCLACSVLPPPLHMVTADSQMEVRDKWGGGVMRWALVEVYGDTALELQGRIIYFFKEDVFLTKKCKVFHILVQNRWAKWNKYALPHQVGLLLKFKMIFGANLRPPSNTHTEEYSW
jgi:hypothetical protein